MKVSNPSNDDFGVTKWPPGFRFHPTDEELILFHLKKKICRRRLKLNVIRELDVYKWEPEELHGQSLLKTGDRQWFFFSPRDIRYPKGGRVNRATRHGHWKSTGKDRNITCNNRIVGVKKTLVFYKGRAPSKERTDWVMHEYTMDEEELKRCETAQDSFALYKVFKKGGAGPKNGEQYGAPFREEEWVEDDDPVDVVQPLNEIPSVNSLTISDEGWLSENDIEEMLGRILDDPKVDQPQIDEFSHLLLHQVGGEEETLSTMVDPSIGEAISMEPRIVLHPDGQQSVARASFDFGDAISMEPRIVLHPDGQQSVARASFEVTQSATSNMYSCEAPEVSSTPTISEQDPHVVEDDFLEMNDLLCPGPSFLEMGNACENLQLQETNGLDVHDLYFDPAMFFQDFEPIDQGMMPQPYYDTLHGDMGSELNYQPSNNVSSELWTHEQRSSIFASPESNQVVVDQGMTPQSYFDTLQGDMASELYYEPSSQSYVTNNVSSDLWTHEQRSSIFASPGSSQVVVAPPISGFVHAGSSTNLVESRQNHGGNEGEPQDSWISSKLSAFLESIPATPASASENALINRAFDRISSFGRVRINANNMDVADTGGTPIVRTGRSRGFGFLSSFLGVMRAVLWVLMLSTTVKVLSTFLGRFVSS